MYVPPFAISLNRKTEQYSCLPGLLRGFGSLLPSKKNSICMQGGSGNLSANGPFICLLLMGYSRKTLKYGGLLKLVSRLVETAAFGLFGFRLAFWGGFFFLIFCCFVFSIKLQQKY